MSLTFALKAGSDAGPAADFEGHLDEPPIEQPVGRSRKGLTRVPGREERKTPGIRGFLLDEDMDARSVDMLRSLGWKAGQPGYDPDQNGVPSKGTPDRTVIK